MKKTTQLTTVDIVRCLVAGAGLLGIAIAIAVFEFIN